MKLNRAEKRFKQETKDIDEDAGEFLVIGEGAGFL
jgi:hypothetical protein